MQTTKRHLKKLIFLISLILIGYVLYLSTFNTGPINRSTKLYAYIEDPTNISTKSIVQIDGYQIGKVNDLKVIKDEVILELLIDNKIPLSKKSILFSVQSSFLGDKYIEVENPNKGKDKYQSGDTIKNVILSKSLMEKLDPNRKHDPKLKEHSKTIGTDLLKNAESPTEKCNINQLKYVFNRIEDSPTELNVKDAYILIENQCKQNVEFSQLQNELIFKFLEINPTALISILNHNNFEKKTIEEFYHKIASPVNDLIEVSKILQLVKEVENSKARNRIINSLEILIN